MSEYIKYDRKTIERMHDVVDRAFSRLSIISIPFRCNNTVRYLSCDQVRSIFYQYAQFYPNNILIIGQGFVREDTFSRESVHISKRSRCLLAIKNLLDSGVIATHDVVAAMAMTDTDVAVKVMKLYCDINDGVAFTTRRNGIRCVEPING